MCLKFIYIYIANANKLTYLCIKVCRKIMRGKKITLILSAINEVAGISTEILKSNSQKSTVVLCRMILVDLSIKLGDVKIYDLAKFLNVTERSVYYYDAKFKDEIKLNPSFKALYAKIVLKIKQSTNKTSKVKTENKVQSKRVQLKIAKAFGVEVVTEHRFHPTRRWRFDFAIPALKIAIEKEGGVWGYGRHNRPVGYINDMEKYNNATALGWRVLRFTPQDIESENALALVQEAINATQVPA